MRPIDFSDCTWIVARELCGQDIAMHFDALYILAKQNKMNNVVLTHNSILATDKDFNKLVKSLIESIYLN